jgi:hypothetical protein
MNTNSRYQGKPLLRLIELYVIDAVGALTPEDDKGLEAMTPKLNQTYGTDDDWRAAIAKAMAFPESLPETIRNLWTRNQQIAKQNGASLSAEAFAVMFVDANIPQQ